VENPGASFFNQIFMIMNDEQTNWHRMYQKVKGVFTANAAITAKYKPVEASFAVFDGLLDEIEQVETAGAVRTTGVFENKIDLKEAMANEAVELASGAFAYAKDKGDTELMAVLSVNFSAIRYGDDQSAYHLAMAVYNELKDHVAELEDFLVTAEDLDGLKQAAERYHAVLQNSRRQDSVARTRQLAGLFGRANDHLSGHLDKLMTRIQRKEPVFYDTYTSARVIVDLGGGRKQISSSGTPE
jgi:hypothetical protein